MLADSQLLYELEATAVACWNFEASMQRVLQSDYHYLAK